MSYSSRIYCTLLEDRNEVMSKSGVLCLYIIMQRYHHFSTKFKIIGEKLF